MSRKKAAPKRSKPKKKPARAADLLSRRDLAKALGCHMMTVTKWEREGLPIAERGGKGRPTHYREIDVRAWLQLRDEAAKQPGALNLMQERARRERAQAALAEQAHQIRMRDLLPREEVEKVWGGEVAAVRAKLLSWSQTLSDQVFRAATVEGLGAVERLLATAVDDVLRELADPARPVAAA